jgi:hypothetical protein
MHIHQVQVGRVRRYHATKAYGGMAPRILNLIKNMTRCNGPQSRSGLCAEERNVFPCPDFSTILVSCSSVAAATTSTTTTTTTTTTTKTKLRGLIPRANYTDRAIAVVGEVSANV